ncbi:phenylalanine--tRNA ligase subunit beta [Pasteurellaceae bacterium HPA106]|uniref:phenylalanine--tRNA ligase subunit beta n=1 Tax=Spirabiliibacterium pneumoniae TaxID=221400 RepID=UPI001AACAAD2|nr:phenylalanine--tRNA ligase subunit beta [Spirabiliibacterium pneumoniae]MBE2896594.1 phenylalanine--tRNA ligase subunit beta [Spirabiliibacterium pneumoniae]
MKLNELWLREWVNPAISTAELAEQITMLGLEVDGIEPCAGDFSGVVVGEVVECKQHPNADKLRVTKVNVGGDTLLDIVCGAPNCRQGLKVACATVGAVLPGDFKIKKAKLRGEPSEGMLCSYKELGIELDSSGIIELPADAPVGQDLRAYLKLDDNSIEISLTPNRADCLSVRGVARELGVVNRVDASEPVIAPVKSTLSDKVAIDVQAPQACPRYLARVIKNVNVQADTPLWMQEKLRRCGLRSIDPVVDVTNYILLELGQPMHAFDADKISQPIVVRMAKEGEQLTLLDESDVKLKANTLVIADQTGPVAMAGIFGGLHTGVTSGTRNVILESAFFAPLAITGRARQYGLHTDSSHRFERGVDYMLQRHAMERATALLIEICGGEAGEICEVVSETDLPKQNSVTLRRSKLDSLLGHHIEDDIVTDILTRLGFDVTFFNDQWTAKPTSWRFDIAIEEDLIEEVARIYGYNAIPNCAPLAHLTMREHKEADVALSRIKTALVDRDYQEAVTYSFVDPKVQQKLHPEQPALILPNPISADMSAMRLSLLPGLLGALVYNQNRQQNRIRLFETGLRFVPDENAEAGVRQEFVLSAVITGPRHNENWFEKSESADFYDLKGDLDSILQLTRAASRVIYVSKVFPALHPGQSAAIVLDGQEVGFIGSLHPQIAQSLGINGRAIVFEILWSALAERDIVQAKPISRFPANRRDIAVVVSQDVAAADVVAACRSAAGETLTQVNLFDVYQGTGVADGCKSLAISLILQDQQKTLEEDDITQIVSNVVSELKQRFNAYLRD